MSHVVVRLGGERFALPMDAVAEVGRMPLLTRVPASPTWVAGVVNWRGRILGVVDVRVLLGLGRAAETASASGGRSDPREASSRLVVLTRPPVSVGIIAERVEGVLTVDAVELEPPLLTLPGDADALLEGQITDSDGPVGVIDAGAVFALRHRFGAVRLAG
ncbi:MAG TPA: chemotaxis protein CheW [Mycobacteriales bacterium]|nr:chemotaxis protein CheW [Mycobacteriales bacterium]